MNQKLSQIAIISLMAIGVFSISAFGQLSGNVNSNFDPFGGSAGNTTGNSPSVNAPRNSRPVNSINAVQPAHRQKVIRDLVFQITQYDRIAKNWERVLEEKRNQYYGCGNANDWATNSCRYQALNEYYVVYRKVELSYQYKAYYQNWLWHYENGR